MCFFQKLLFGLESKREYVAKTCKGFPYSKGVSDIIKEYKKQSGTNKHLIQYMEHLAKGESPTIVDGKITLPPNKNGQKTILFTRRSVDSISKEEIKAIFRHSETGKFEVSKEKYETFLKENPEEQKLFPKNIYDLIPYFQDEDGYASSMIHSIKYLKFLLEGDKKEATKERQMYCQKKIEESKTSEIQNMLMFVWRYLEKNGDKSFSDWTTFAKSEVIAKMMKDNPDLTKKILNNANSIASYSITNTNTNFNKLNYGSLKQILLPKVEEIKAIPDIYNKKFKI